MVCKNRWIISSTANFVMVSFFCIFLGNEKCAFFFPLFLGNAKCAFLFPREWEMWPNKASKFLFISDQHCCCCRPPRSIVNDCRGEIFWYFSFFISIYFLDLLYFCWTTCKTQNWSIKGMNRDSSLQLKQPPPLICCVMLTWVGLNCTTPPILSPEVSQERKGWGGGVGGRGEEEGGLAGDWASRPGCHLFPTLPGYQTIISTIFG